jgi:hypothetical protein
MKLNFNKIVDIAQHIFSEQTGEDLANMGDHGKQAIIEGKIVALIALEMAKRIAAGDPMETESRALLSAPLESLVNKGMTRYLS